MEKQTKKDKKVPMKNKAGPATPTIVKDKVLDFVKFVIDQVKYVHKQRCLVLASRGVSYRTRHLMKDLEGLLPHHKSDVKV